MAKEARRIRVTGRVQGVGFRFFTVETAQRLGIGGWVRNAEDGSVQAYAEGDPEALDAFVDALKDGPTFGNVEDVEVTPCERTEKTHTFEVRY